jgi:hypothetical protein
MVGAIQEWLPFNGFGVCTLAHWCQLNVSLAVETAATRNFTCLEQVTLREGFAYKNPVKIQACMAQNKMLEAVNTALPVLKLLEVEFP